MTITEDQYVRLKAVALDIGETNPFLASVLFHVLACAVAGPAYVKDLAEFLHPFARQQQAILQAKIADDRNRRN
jgi:hypothetical protein